MLHQLLGIVVAVVLGHIYEAAPSACTPGNKREALGVQLKENLQDGQEKREGEDIEECRQHIHHEGAGNVLLVSGEIGAHDSEK